MKAITLTSVTGEGDYGEDDLRTEQTAPVTILNPWDRIRSFTPRKHGKPGTRIVFTSGAGLPVTESPEQVLAALNALNQ